MLIIAYLDMFPVHRLPEWNAQRASRERVEDGLQISQPTARRIVYLLENTSHDRNGTEGYQYTHSTLQEELIEIPGQ